MKKAKGLLRKRWKLILAVLVLFVMVIWLFGFKDSKKDLKTINIQRGKIQEELILSGTVTATNYAKLSFESSGKIVYVGVKEGDEVRKGKLLTKLDTTLLNSEYQKALSDLRYYEANVEYIHDTVKGNDDDETFVQKDTRTYSEVNKDKAWENVVKAKRSLDGASLYAPFNGIITYVANPFVGVNILSTTTQIEIIDPSTMYFEVLADQTEVVKLEKGKKVRIYLDAFEDKEIEGIVDNVSFSPISGESGFSYSIKVIFTNIDLLVSNFKIGMSGDANFVISEKDDALYVPSVFVNSDKEGKYVFTKPRNGKVYIETGLESEEDIEIIGDIKEGQILYD